MEDDNETQSVINNYQIVYNNMHTANGLFFCPFSVVLLSPYLLLDFVIP